MTDIAGEIAERIRACKAAGRGVRIVGGDSKAFLGQRPAGELECLDMASHSGVISYEPKELVLRARAGTRIAEIVALLAAEGQMLGFEPPDFGGAATLGGTIAAGLSGARRPWSGAARDFVLGAGLITGEGEQLEFGGQVMKNVAGFDVSRLLAGSMGTLGVIADVSLKVLPAPQRELTLARPMAVDEAHRTMVTLSNRSLPLSGACYGDGRLHLRLSGSETGVEAAARSLEGEPAADDVWRDAGNLTFGALAGATRLWRLSVPKTSSARLNEASVVDWAGAQRWLADPDFDPRDGLQQGHATLFRAPDDDATPRFSPLAGPLLALHQGLKKTFDPAGILNPGRLYGDI